MLARLSDSEITEIAGMVTDRMARDVMVVVEPTVGMVMARAIEGAQGEVFNVGEVLVTECQVQIDHHEGWSMLMGSRPQGALAAATVDAAMAAGVVDPASIDAVLIRLIAVHDAELAARQAELAATRVQFDTQ
jgi:alpha-D-ribose 1-methylphosphonate 5-triphosphate synthase subunit PhnG